MSKPEPTDAKTAIVRCAICSCPIKPGQRAIPFLHNEELRSWDHGDAADCIAATRSATARECAEIAEEQAKAFFDEQHPSWVGYRYGAAAVEKIIRAKFNVRQEGK